MGRMARVWRGEWSGMMGRMARVWRGEWSGMTQKSSREIGLAAAILNTLKGRYLVGLILSYMPPNRQNYGVAFRGLNFTLYAEVFGEDDAGDAADNFYIVL